MPNSSISQTIISLGSQTTFNSMEHRHGFTVNFYRCLGGIVGLFFDVKFLLLKTQISLNLDDTDSLLNP